MRRPPCAAILEPVGATIRRPPDPRGSLVATYALLLEAARRPALQRDRRALDRGLPAHARAACCERPAPGDPRADAELLLGAADGLLIEQLAAGADD